MHFLSRNCWTFHHDASGTCGGSQKNTFYDSAVDFPFDLHVAQYACLYLGILCVSFLQLIHPALGILPNALAVKSFCHWGPVKYYNSTPHSPKQQAPEMLGKEKESLKLHERGIMGRGAMACWYLTPNAAWSTLICCSNCVASPEDEQTKNMCHVLLAHWPASQDCDSVLHEKGCNKMNRSRLLPQTRSIYLIKNRHAVEAYDWQRWVPGIHIWKDGSGLLTYPIIYSPDNMLL